jgi:hypothetical protein
LLEELEQLQSKLFEYAWSNNIIQLAIAPVIESNNVSMLLESNKVSGNIEIKNEGETSEIAKLEHYRQTGKTDKRKAPRNWQTRKDPFERVWDEAKLKLELNPELTAKTLLDGLIAKYPTDYKPNHLRTLQRRVSHWRQEQLDQEARLRAIMLPNEAELL